MKPKKSNDDSFSRMIELVWLQVENYEKILSLAPEIAKESPEQRVTEKVSDLKRKSAELAEKVDQIPDSGRYGDCVAGAKEVFKAMRIEFERWHEQLRYFCSADSQEIESDKRELALQTLENSLAKFKSDISVLRSLRSQKGKQK